MKTMPANEEQARATLRAFWETEERKGEFQTRFKTPHTIRLDGWTHDGKAKVTFAPYQIADLNPQWISDQTRTGIYKSPETLTRAFEQLRPAFNDAWTNQRAVFRFRRSGIPEMSNLANDLKADFQTTPVLIPREDDRGIYNPSRARYALAYSDRQFQQGKLTCPHCTCHAWEETILGWTCEGCGKTWIDAIPKMEGWS